jgi:hypothetical protein
MHGQTIAEGPYDKEQLMLVEIQLPGDRPQGTLISGEY